MLHDLAYFGIWVAWNLWGLFVYQPQDTTVDDLLLASLPANYRVGTTDQRPK